MPYLLIVLGVIARVLPHTWNFAPMGAIGLYAGAQLKLRTALLIPLVTLFIGDLIIRAYGPNEGFIYSLTEMSFVYLGFLAGPLIGRFLLARRRSIPRFGIAVFSAATLHFIISNIGSWLTLYPQTFDGLVQCYVLALPFYGSTLLGDAIYAAIFFGCHELVQRYRTGSTEVAGT